MTTSNTINYQTRLIENGENISVRGCPISAQVGYFKEINMRSFNRIENDFVHLRNNILICTFKE